MKVVVIGGGAAGLGVGWRLLQAGAQVTVLDRAQPGHGATWAAAGMIAPASEHGGDNPTEAGFASYSSVLWPSFAKELEEKSGVQIGYRRCGSLVCSHREGAPAPAGARRLDTAAARALEPMLTCAVQSALWLEDEAQVENRALGRALVRAFLAAGGELLANEPVVRIENDGARVLGARTPFNVFEGDAYVLAAGAWTGRIEGLADSVLPPVVPVKGEMISLVPPPGAVMPACVVRDEHVYLVPRAARLCVGATMENAGFDTSLTPRARQWLFDSAVALMPDLAHWPLHEHWAGLRPGSPDRLPILGQTALSGLFAATGQYRNGILFAPAVAESLCALILGRAPGVDLRSFDPRRFAGAEFAQDSRAG